MRRLVLFLLVACGQPAKHDTTTPPPAVAPMAHDATCPLEVPGTSVTVEDTPNGKSFPATEPLVAETGDLVRIRLQCRRARAAPTPPCSCRSARHAR